ncbi:MAG: hypothetical protein ACOZNI_12405 [Myxococcota bacterium]
MPRLLRVHYASVGYRDARLDPVTLDLRHAEGTGGDSVVWLRNGGGKSSILSLFFSLLRPDRREFLATISSDGKKKLEDYVKEDDLACVLTEWDVEPPASPGLFGRAPRRTRVFGQAFGWEGRQRSANPARLKAVRFALYLDERTMLEHLPVRGLDGSPVGSLGALTRWLDDLQGRRPELEVLHTENQREWLELLDRAGIDPELYRYQVRMNRVEGGADETFRFGSAEEFIDFLLELALDHADADEVAAGLGEFADKLRKRPAYELERDFVAAALNVLTPLADALAVRTDAERRLVDAARAAGAMATALRERAVTALARAEAEGKAQKAAEEELTRQATRRRTLDRWAVGLHRRGLALRKDEAEAALAAAQASEASSRVAKRVALAARALGQLRVREAEHRAKDQAHRQLQAERAPQLREVEEAGEVLWRALDRAGERLSEFRRREGERAAAADARAEAARVRAETILQAKGRWEQIRQDSESRLGERDAARAILLRDGIVMPYEELDAAASRWRAKVETASAALLALAGRDGELAGQIEAAAAERTRLEGEIVGVRSRAERLEGAVREARDERDRLQAHPRVVEVEEIEPANVDAPGLVARLGARADALQRQLLESAVDGAEDARAIVALDHTGLLPSPTEVERAVELLREAGVPAHPGMAWVAENETLPRREELLRADPARFAGVLVPDTESLERARTLLGARGSGRQPMTVSVASLDVEAAGTERLVLLPETAGAYDQGAAGMERVRVEERRARRSREDSVRRAHQLELEDASGRIAQYLDRWGRGELARLEQEAEAARILEQSTAGAIARLEPEVSDLKRRREDVARQVREEVHRREAAQGAIARLDVFREAHERHVDALRAALEEAARELLTAEPQLAEARTVQAAANAEAESARATQNRAKLQGEALAAERAGVTYRMPDAALQETEVEAARATFGVRRTTYERAVSEDRSAWELQLAATALKEAREAYDRESAGLEEADIRETWARHAPEIEELLEGRARELEAAIGAVGEARSAAKAATDALLEGARRREAEDLPTDDPPPSTSAEAFAAETRWREESAALFEVMEETRERATVHGRRKQESIEDDGRCMSEIQVLEAAIGQLPAAPSAPLPAEAADVRTRVASLVDRWKEAHASAERTRHEVERRAEAVRRAANDDRFAEHHSPVKERLRGDTAELAGACVELREKLASRQEVLGVTLADIDADRQTLLVLVEQVASHASDLLRRAGNASVLPETLQGWAGRPYLQARFEVPSTPAERRARLEPLVDALVQEAHLPSGLRLAQRALKELAGGRFDVTILKPHPSFRTDRVPVAALATFSGAERLTAAVLLYCTLVQLRAVERGKGRGRAEGGVLVLDNPIGTCSSIPLLQLQRTVARQMRVQLVYTTHVGDLEALATIPNIVRLRNGHRDRRTGDFHVTREEGVEGVRISRTTE